MEGGRSAWLKAVMAAKKPGMSLGDAMKAAKKTYKKGGAGSGGVPEMPPAGGRRRGSRKVKGGAAMPAMGLPTQTGVPAMPSLGGMLAMPPMGGRRRRSTRKMMGGIAYGFTGGPYTGSDLPDGMSRFPSLPDATYQGPSTLKGGRRRSRRGGAFAPSSDGHAAQLPYDKPSVAPGTAVGANGTFSQSGSAPAAFGGRRRRHTKKAGRRRHRGGNHTQGSAMVYGAASSEAAAAARQAAAARNGYA